MLSLIPSDTSIDFMGRWRPLAAVSALLVAASLVVVGSVGLPLGIDFAGGVETRLRIPGEQPVGEAEIRAALAQTPLSETAISRVGDASDRSFVVRTAQSDRIPLEQIASQIETTLTQKLGGAIVERVDVVGPRAGREFRQQAWVAIGASLGLIAVYMGFRFAPRYVPGAVVALVHDAILSTAAVIVCGYPIDFTVIAALLTVVGYSLNDTIVIYDRIRENIGLRTTAEIERLVNDSLNETLSRTVLTAGTTLLSSLALLTWGGEALRGFSIAITAGVFFGTYSSLFVATPMLLALSRRASASGWPLHPAAPARRAPAGATPARAGSRCRGRG